MNTDHLHRPSRGSRPVPALAVVYAVIAVAGLASTWYFNLTYTGENYLGDWFANAAASSAAIDILIAFTVCTIFYFTESRRRGYKIWVPLLFTAASLIIAVAFAFPLFLALREITLRRERTAQSSVTMDA